jgi:hypothetical protein
MSSVYFVKPIGSAGPIKIGFSNDVDKRMMTLTRWSPVDLEVIALLPGDTVLERRLHRHFLDTHWRNEWFHWSRPLADLIAAVSGGSFDETTIGSDSRPVWYEHHGVMNRAAQAKRTRKPADATSIAA